MVDWADLERWRREQIKVGFVLPVTKELLMDSGRYGCDCPCHRKSPKRDLGCPCAPVIQCRFCGRRHGRRYACDALIAAHHFDGHGDG